MYVVYGAKAFSESALFGRLEVVESATLRNDDRWVYSFSVRHYQLFRKKHHHAFVTRIRLCTTSYDGIKKLTSICAPVITGEHIIRQHFFFNILHFLAIDTLFTFT